MKKLLLISILVLAVFYAFKEIVYKPYMWKKAMNTPEHRLQMGSFLFSKQTGSNGSQSTQTNYLIFKVVEINGDYVRLSAIRQLSEKGQNESSDFSFTRNTYHSLKQNINKLTITGIPGNDLYKEGANYTVNDYLLNKYPSLKKSRYYYEELSNSEKNILSPTEYFSLVYSKEKIIEKRKLIPWISNNNGSPELVKSLSQKVSLILN
ncbi:hypothetical protein SAMN05444671_0850 [Flavobacterium sp. CF108]|uniref:hypothetical protein n=1 Tax=unclassified Flavobacterium TaxID=196869 RepID=UPI0008C205F1|nr:MULTISPECIES: hypothetical protein [unclassified Flavobacterium]SEO15228.1 hypothetical protein SAMN04487978_2228 [Flavobacterium sp. fv08]SHG57568.1 hypothetical protein SAMN05444671_0850 [Flavobacterium sp. CF108]